MCLLKIPTPWALGFLISASEVRHTSLVSDTEGLSQEIRVTHVNAALRPDHFLGSQSFLESHDVLFQACE